MWKEGRKGERKGRKEWGERRKEGREDRQG
jgi:hypothetical protein